MTTQSKKRQVKRALKFLRQRFRVFRNFKPLALNFHLELEMTLSEFSDKQVLQRAIQAHCTSSRYLKSFAKERFRYDIHGRISGELSLADREFAADKIRAYKRDEFN